MRSRKKISVKINKNYKLWAITRSKDEFESFKREYADEIKEFKRLKKLRIEEI